MVISKSNTTDVNDNSRPKRRHHVHVSALGKGWSRAMMALLALLAWHCSKGQTDGAVDGSQTPNPAGGTGPMGGGSGFCTESGMPSAPVGDSQIIFSISTNIDPCSVRGYVVGFQDQLKVKRAVGNKFFVDHVPAGARDLLVLGSAKTSGSSLLDSQSDRGLRLANQKILNGVATEISEPVDLPVLGSIQGKVSLMGASEAAGVDIYIPGTGFLAKADLNGKFNITGVPVGHHQVFFEKAGYRRGQFDQVRVEAGKSIEIGNMLMAIDTGSDGFVILSGGSGISNSRTVDVTVGATNDAILMKISEDQSFVGASWRPITTSLPYTFDRPGAKSLYVKFANSNGLETSPFKADILIDVFSDARSPFAPTFVVGDVAPPSSDFAITDISVPSNAVGMMIADSPNFSGAAWQNPAPIANFSYPKNYASCGQKTFYLKFRDKDGFESQVVSRTANLACWRAISVVNAPNITSGINGANGSPPGLSAWTGSEMLVWGYRDSLYSGNSSFSGGAYNPSTNAWRSLSTQGYTGTLFGYAAVWAGNKWIVWGGSDSSGSPLHSDGAIYSPGADSWMTVGQINAPSMRYNLSAVWTGSTGNPVTENRMILWGGQSYSYPTDGYSYHPASDSWTQISTIGAPDARSLASTGWVNNRMVVWGGYSTCPGCQPINTGGIYDPTSDSWSAMASGGPSPRYGYVFVPTSTGKIFVWGGFGPNGQNVIGDGMMFDVQSNSWSPVPSAGAPTARAYATALAISGGRIFLFGGIDQTNNCSSGAFSNGAIFDPSSGTWTLVPYPQTASGNGNCNYYTATWTGSEVIMWAPGGGGMVFTPF